MSFTSIIPLFTILIQAKMSIIYNIIAMLCTDSTAYHPKATFNFVSLLYIQDHEKENQGNQQRGRHIL